MTDEFVLNELKDMRRQIEELVTDDKGEAAAIDAVLRFPGLVGFWPMSVTNSSGEAVDISGNGLHLTNISDSLFNVTNSTVGHAEYDGSADYHTHADAADFDIIGTESYIDSSIRGLTFGCWVKTTTDSGNEWVMSKHNAATNAGSSYYVAKLGNDWGLNISSGSSAEAVVTTGGQVAAGAWQLVICKFVPSTSLDIFIDGVKTTGAATFSSINNSAVAFNIAGRNDGSNLFDGDISLAFLCSAQVSDTQLNDFFELSRPLFGV